MTDTDSAVVAVAEPPPTDRQPIARIGRRDRITLIVVGVASVLPFYWAAARDARRGFFPTQDIAATVVRARATLSAHPPLYGMWSSGSNWSGHEIHFPGATQLYLLAIPTHLLGNTWGPLIAMATINAFWIVLTAWLVYRHLGHRAALITFALLSVFTWSLGSENLIDARPMEMVTIPFLCFLVIAWLVTAGDIDALPGLALVANYLFLNHLVMTVQVPVICLCAVVGVVVWWRRPPGVVDPWAQDRARRGRRFRRRLLQAGAITLVMWLPSLIQQVTGRPGNLIELAKASTNHPPRVGSWTAAYDVTISLIAKPRFWFRGSFSDPYLVSGLRHVTAWDVLAGIAVAAIIGTLVVIGWRRRDRYILAAMGVSSVGIATSIVTVTQAPTEWGFPLPFLRGLWGLAAFVWFGVAYSLWRIAGSSFQRRVTPIAAVTAVTFAVLALSFADFGASTDVEWGPYARRVNDRTVPILADMDGPVLVNSAGDFASERFFASLVLGLDSAKVPYCVTPYEAQQYEHDCGARARSSVLVQAGVPDPPAGAKLISRTNLMSPQDVSKRDRARRTIDAWLGSHREIELTPAAWRLIDAAPTNHARVKAVVAPADGDLSDVVASPTMRLLVELEQQHRDHPSSRPAIFAQRDFPHEAMTTYFPLSVQARAPSLQVYLLHDGAGRSHHE